MQELVPNLRSMRQLVRGAGARLEVADNDVAITAQGKTRRLRVIRLYRPSASEVARAAGSDAILMLVEASPRAVAAAAPFNHVVVPNGGFRLVVPGLAVVREAEPLPPKATRRVRLTGRTGIVAETLLLGGERQWSVHDLAAAARVSPSLAHRVVRRLEAEALVASSGAGPQKLRALLDPGRLAEMWSREEQPPHVVLRGHMYGTTPAAVAQRALEACSQGAVGGVLAANLYAPTLTRVPYPIRLWVPETFSPDELMEAGFEITMEGANLELLQAKHDPWQVHATANGLARVSKWRAWVEIAGAAGRVAELADALWRDLKGVE